MLAGAGIDRQHEHQPSWAPGPVGRRGGCDRQLYADADRRVHARQPVSRAMLSWPTGALFGNSSARVMTRFWRSSGLPGNEVHPRTVLPAEKPRAERRGLRPTVAPRVSGGMSVSWVGQALLV